MMDDMHKMEEEANTSTNAPPIQRCLADSSMKLVNAPVSALRSGDPPTIYRVPHRFRRRNKAAYEPQIVSIGPYHKRNKSLQGMEEHKRRYLRSFLSRNPEHPVEYYLKAMEDFLKATEESVDKARSCYSDNISLQMDEFVKMMVLDACFIVEFFLRITPMEYIRKELGTPPPEFFLNSDDSADPILGTIEMASLIGYDMLLLENQIPFFLLQHIFKIACPVNVPHVLENFALDFFHRFMPRNEKIEINDSYYHLLHLFHSHLLPTPTNSKEEPNLSCIPKIKPYLSCKPKIKSVLNKLMKLLIIILPCLDKAPLPITQQRMIPCVADLQLVGVKFKKNEESNSILDVKFSDGVLEIPQLFIEDYTNTLLRNLVAFEQLCYPKVKQYFTNYVCFMDCLVNTSKDVALLRGNGIIDHLLGSDDAVARLFNHLCIGIFNDLKERFLWDVKERVRKHCENTWNVQCAILNRNYFANPWSVISFIAALTLLVLTITQTIFTIIPYYRPRS